MLNVQNSVTLENVLTSKIILELLEEDTKYIYTMGLTILYNEFRECGVYSEKKYCEYIKNNFSKLSLALQMLEKNVLDFVNIKEKYKYYMQLVNIWVDFNKKYSNLINKENFQKYLEEKFLKIDLIFKQLKIDIYEIVKNYSTEDYYVVPN